MIKVSSITALLYVPDFEILLNFTYQIIKEPLFQDITIFLSSTHVNISSETEQSIAIFQELELPYYMQPFNQELFNQLKYLVLSIFKDKDRARIKELTVFIKDTCNHIYKDNSKKTNLLSECLASVYRQLVEGFPSEDYLSISEDFDNTDLSKLVIYEFNSNQEKENYLYQSLELVDQDDLISSNSISPA